jgi:hypothetical protein
MLISFDCPRFQMSKIAFVLTHTRQHHLSIVIKRGGAYYCSLLNIVFGRIISTREFDGKGQV